MNQFVAPTSRITSTSRRRAKMDSRIVLATSSTDASTSKPASEASRIFIVLVADRIFSVSSSRSLISWIAGLMKRLSPLVAVGCRLLFTRSAFCGSSSLIL